MAGRNDTPNKSGEGLLPNFGFLDTVRSLVRREKEKSGTELTDAELASLDELDILHSTSDVGAFITADAVEELEEEERASQIGDEDDASHKKLELNSWFSTLSSLLPTTSPSTADFLSQITLGIQLATKSSAKDDNKKIFNHNLHQFENPQFKMNFDVKEFCAGAFRDLRNLYNISTDDYVNEWNLPQEQLNASEGAGKSGALFCFSTSKKFIFKTIFKSEVETLISCIKDYHNYCHTRPNTLIMKMIGLYCFSRASLTSTETYVLVFGNVTWSGVEKAYPIEDVFDLKGRKTKVSNHI